ncbi:unnamed protein product [Oppiella nova]|uniref:Sulfatase N-terminal domain-containing protein n=1 Tax=Oppiella nova TaxID=334625 RepID=A0A7R9MPQ3_9ACAR|nr:unnamed protein product [Oppiella nova]CAG2180855.1 unnamed protein product [Oppiella nova]
MHERKQKYFAYHFMVKVTHDDLNGVGLLDPLIHRLFTRLFANNLLNNTVLVFFSDHGMRFGSIRETLSGKYEDRLPAMHIYLPSHLRTHNMTVNEHRLTTHFDIHATLKHILEGKPNNTLKYGKTLLEEIPVTRSCQSIPILEHFCSCQSSQVITDLKSVEVMSKFIVKQLNQLLYSTKNS